MTILEQAETIRDETQPRANTHTRVGTCLVDIAEELAREKSDCQIYMSENATATVISAQNTFYKAAGTTTESDHVHGFTAENNRVICGDPVERHYMVMVTVSFTAGNNNICEFGIYSSRDEGVIQASHTKSTANSSGRAENIALMCPVVMVDGDYVELWVSNTSAVANITVSDMNFVVFEL